MAARPQAWCARSASREYAAQPGQNEAARLATLPSDPAVMPRIDRRRLIVTGVPTLAAGRMAYAQVGEFYGQFTTTHSLPIVKIVIDSGPLGMSQNAIALVDTGSSACLLDQSIVEKLNLTPVGRRESLTHDGIRTDPTYDCRFTLPDGTTFSMDAGARPMRASTHPFDAVLGMTVLRYYDLRIRAKDGIVMLQWAGA
jgi:hypothetical protein